MKEEKNRLPAEVWLDYIENETEKSLKEDLERVLSYRPEYKKTVTQLIELKKHLKDTATDLPSDETFKKLKNNIMAAIEKTEPDKKLSPWHKHNKAMTYTTMTIAAVVAGGIVSQTEFKGTQKGEQSYSLEDNILISQDLNELSEEVLIEVAATKISQMPENMAQNELNKLK
ncbi:MAG: hypothetical protein IPM57_01640 [Oligoflexia bacterium]|nr:hypothetical protein [Oligoflexia bacterium]